MTPRAWAIKQSDIDACPKRSLLPKHYREDGSCRCNEECRECTEKAEWEVGFRGSLEGSRRYCTRHAEEAWERGSFDYKIRYPYMPPYPFCTGNPTIAACARVGYCRKDPACDE